MLSTSASGAAAPACTPCSCARWRAASGTATTAPRPHSRWRRALAAPRQRMRRWQAPGSGNSGTAALLPPTPLLLPPPRRRCWTSLGQTKWMLQLRMAVEGPAAGRRDQQAVGRPTAAAGKSATAMQMLPLTCTI